MIFITFMHQFNVINHVNNEEHKSGSMVLFQRQDKLMKDSSIADCTG